MSRAIACSPPGRRSRSCSSSARSRRWYSSLPIASIRARSASPPSRSNSARRRRPYLTVSVCQPAASNIPIEAPGRDVGDDAVQRLAVEVDDPQHLAQPRHHRVDDRLPDGALVELGVAQQRDLAPAARDVEVPGDVAMGHRAPDRRGGPDPDAPGRVVDGVGVLRAAGIGLKAAVLAQPRQVGRVQAPEQEVDRVQDRRGVRLDRHAVGRLEVREPQRGHERDHRRARGLVAAHLDPARVQPHAVGVVDDGGGQPQDAALDRVEDVEVGLRRVVTGLHRGHRQSFARP